MRKGALRDNSACSCYALGEVMMMRDIGKNIKTLREGKGMTQEELAQALFVTRQTVSNYETGRSRPDIKMLLSIARALETDVNAVLYGPAPAQPLGRKRFLISAALFCLLTAAVMLLRPLALDLQKQRFLLAPRHAVELFLRPAAMLLGGWSAMQGAGLLLKVQPLRSAIRAKRALLALLLLCFALLLPFFLWSCFSDFRLFTESHVSTRFSLFPAYNAVLYRLVSLTCDHVSLYALWGGALWLTDFPKTPAGED